jgi:stage V sporulation protein SpoVS
MVNSVPLTSSAVVNASGVGMLGVQIGFSAHAFADAISTGNMTLILRLSGQAVAQAVGSGALSQSGILQANPRYTINALGRNFTINALGRNFTINAL